jgi:hypothetical protein
MQGVTGGGKRVKIVEGVCIWCMFGIVKRQGGVE